MSIFTFLLIGQLVGVPGELVRAVCKVESGLNPAAIHHSDGHSKSYGLCQIKLATARQMGYDGTVQGLMDPETNAMYAAKYLKMQKERYGNWLQAISAYNAGRAIISNRNYVRQVLNEWR